MKEVKKIDFSEYDFDILEAGNAKKFETELAKVVKINEESKGYVSMSKVVLANCNAVCEFFDNILGEGTAKKFFGGVMHIGQTSEVFRQFVEYTNTQAERFAEAQKPEENREQRRSKSKKQ